MQILDGDESTVSISAGEVTVEEFGTPVAVEVVLTAQPQPEEGKNPNTASVQVDFLVASGYCVDPTRGRNYTLGCSEDSDCPDTGMNCNVDATIRVNPPRLSFGTSDWNIPRKVVITAFGDDVDEDEFSVLVYASVQSTDLLFNGPNAIVRFGGKDVPDDALTVTIKDRNEAGFTLSPEQLYVQEGSLEGSVFSVSLDSKPWTTVSVVLNEIAVGGSASSLALYQIPCNFHHQIGILRSA